MKEQAIMICAPVEGFPSAYVKAGWTIDDCNECGRGVYLAPSGKKFKDEENAILQCTRCALPWVIASGQSVEVRKEVIEELRQTAPDVLYELKSMLRRHRARNN